MLRSRIAFGAALLLAATAAVPAALASDHGASVKPMDHCDRACLYGFLDVYKDALAKRDPSRLPLARNVRFSENSVELQIGDGLWNTIDGVGKYDLRLADTKTGNVGWYGVVYEHGVPAAIAARLKVEDGRITEIETVLARRVGDGPFPNPDPEALKPSPIMNEIVPPAQRVPRARMISLADGYFDTLQLNDGTIFTQFDPACDRIENGVPTTHNPKLHGTNDRIAAMGCEDQFKLGAFRYDDRLRARRYPLVDEERGLVMAGGFIDHSAKVTEVTLTDGTKKKSSYKTPHSFCLLEVFKIVDGKIREIQAVFPTVTYGMPTPWKD